MGTKDRIEKLLADPEVAARVDAYLKADYEAEALGDDGVGRDEDTGTTPRS